MKKFSLIILFIIFFTPMAIGASIEGGVSYNVEEAREYVFEGKPQNVEVNQPYILKINNAIERKVYSYNNNNKLIGVTVLYKNEPDKTYIYDANNRLIYVEQYDKSVNVYPHRGYRYDMNGTLVLTSLTVSKEEMFRFEPNGRLIVHSVNGIIYDENGNVIGRGKTVNSGR